MTTADPRRLILQVQSVSHHPDINSEWNLILDTAVDKAIARARAELCPLSKWLTVPEAAKILKYKTSVALAKACADGTGPKSCGTGKPRRIRIDWLDAYQESLPSTGGDAE